MQPLQWIIRTDEPFRGVSQSFTYKQEDGTELVAYTGLTLEEYAKARDYPFKLISGDELDALILDFEKSIITPWIETTEETYDYALEVLPPCKYSRGKFHVSERIRGDLVHWYKQENGKYYTKTDYSNKGE